MTRLMESIRYACRPGGQLDRLIKSENKMSKENSPIPTETTDLPAVDVLIDEFEMCYSGEGRIAIDIREVTTVRQGVGSAGIEVCVGGRSFIIQADFDEFVSRWRDSRVM